MISINTNMGLMRADRAVSDTGKILTRTLERLATGRRINRAEDDPAGLVASEGLSAQIQVIQKKIDASAQVSSYLGAREGAQSVLSDLMAELSGIVVTAANRDGLSGEERRSLQLQADSIIKTIDHVGLTTTYKGDQLLSGLHAGGLGQTQYTTTDANGQTVTRTGTLADLATGGALNLVDGDLETAQKVVQTAGSGIATTRSAIGSQMKAMDSETRSLQTELENLTEARSQILDTDYAKETATLVRNQVLQEAASFARQVAVDQNKRVLDLIRPLAPRA